MKLPLLSRLSPRLRVLVLLCAAVLCLGGAAALYGNHVFLTPPPPAFQARRATPNTDVNPYGANFFLEREVEAWKRERTVQMAREAGIGWARQEFIWAEIEPEPGSFNWAKYDDIVELLRRNNIQIIARLDRPPAWARSHASATGSSGPPDDLEAYGKFVRAFAEHFRDRIYYFQIWNEPNLGREWNDAPIDPAAYTNLLKIAYQNAHAVDPDIRILSAPLAITLGEAFTPNSTQYRNMNDLQFLEEMYAAGAKDYFDILSANAFGLGSAPDDPPNPGKLNFQRVLLERAVMEKFNDTAKAVWILEYGWNAAPDTIPDSRLIWGRVTEEQQAQHTVRGVEMTRENWDWVGVVSIWYFRQVGDIPPNNPEYYFRMVDVDFAPRPVYFSVSAAAKPQRVAGPGEYEETNPALVFSGNWLYQSDINASAAQFIRTSDTVTKTKTDTATLRFYGQGLDLMFRREPGAGRLFVTIDGKAVSDLPRDESGQSFMEQASARQEWRAVIPAARGLPLAEHTVTLRAEGAVNLDGFTVLVIQPTPPPWLPIGFFSALGLGCVFLAWTQQSVPRRKREG
ncbi:MAG: beta-galactosidase [Chloroflexi bacterium]|nr:beta-galactosidase [Chloroflexota bacterium]